MARYTSIRTIPGLETIMNYKIHLCQENFLEWCSRGGSVRGTTTRIQDTRQEDPCLQIEQGLVWIETSTKEMV